MIREYKDINGRYRQRERERKRLRERKREIYRQREKEREICSVPRREMLVREADPLLFATIPFAKAEAPADLISF